MPEIHVEVDDVLYMPGLETPGDRPHPFAYFITIWNRSSDTVQIKARKWVVRESNGEVVVVEGEGVVGKFPLLKPGESFSYNSYHVLQCDGRAEGSFFGITAAGRPVYARIPSFEMVIPQWA